LVKPKEVLTFATSKAKIYLLFGTTHTQNKTQQKLQSENIGSQHRHKKQQTTNTTQLNYLRYEKD